MSIYRQTNGEIYQEYQIAATTAASTAQLLALIKSASGLFSVNTVVLEARGAAITFLFGATSATTASATVTSNALPTGNFSLATGAVLEIDINALTQSYVSVITATGSGTAVIKLLKSYR